MFVNIKMVKLRSITVWFLLLIIMQSCSIEKKLAVEFANNANGKSVLVISPQQIFKTNLKTYILDSIEAPVTANKDSLLISNSLFLRNIDDSLFLANYLIGYTKALKSFDIEVFTESQIEDFLLADSNTYQVNIAQIELEETIYTYRDEASAYDRYYYHDHDLNAIYINSWFEIAADDNNNTNQKVYFATDMISDVPDGVFDYDIFSNKVRYMYNIDSLNVGMVYDFAYKAGALYAAYTFDLFMNQQLNKKLPTDSRSEKYWRYDPYRKVFFPATDDKFILLDQ